jgi:integrase
MKRKSNKVTVAGVKVGTLYQREGTTSWWFRWAPPSGHIQKMTTGQENYGDAERWAMQYAAEHASDVCATSGAAVPSSRARTLASALALYVKGKYKSDNTGDWNANTMRRALHPLNLFVEFLGKDSTPGIITKERIVSWNDHERTRTDDVIDPGTKQVIRQEKANSPSTLSTNLGCIKAFVYWLVDEKYLFEKPSFKKIAPPKSAIRKSARKRSWNPAEVAKIARHLADAGRTYWLDLFKVGVGTGVRPGELVHLRACDFNAEVGVLKVHEYKDWSVKTEGSVRTIPLENLAPEVKEALIRRKKEAEKAAGSEALLFPKFGRGLNRERVEEPWTEDSLRNAFQRVIEGCGVDGFPYMWRHSFSRRAYAAEWSDNKIAKFMGHTETDTTRGYGKEVTAAEFKRRDVLAGVLEAVPLTLVAVA